MDRLPDGNMLIDEGMNGRFFQVTPAGDIVSDHVLPFRGPAPTPPGRRGALSNWVYWVQNVPYDRVPAGTLHAEVAVRPHS